MKSICFTYQIILTTCLLMMIPILDVSAQNCVTITQNNFVHKDDSVYVDLEIELNHASISKRAYVLLTPVIQKYEQLVHLPATLINGKSRQKIYLRMIALGQEPENVGQVIRAETAGTTTFHYSAAVPYEPWMTDADFAILEEQCECSDPLVKIKLISGKMEDLNPTQFFPSYREPNPEQIKKRSETGKAYLDFVPNSADLKPNFANNAFELANIGNMITNIKEQTDVETITEIIISGFASPEGSFEANLKMSNRRAMALKNYLRTVYQIDDHLLHVEGHGEDWKTLEELISTSNLEHRQEALEIIRNTTNPDERERKLKLFKDGSLYKKLLGDYFPMLRRVDYELRFAVTPFTVEKGEKTMESDPSLLSLNEMYLIAQTYPVGSAEFRRLFDIAAATYPDDETANFNVAANALDIRDPALAEKHLSLVKIHDAARENNMGIFHTLQGNYEKAFEHFHKALEGGNTEASKNIQEMDKFYDVAQNRKKFQKN